MPKKKTTDEFVADAIRVHGDKYLYVHSRYVNNKVKVAISGPQHGEFWMSPNSHLRGQGCPKCGDIAMANKRRGNLDEFVIASKKVHGDLYDYSEVEYVDTHTNVEIICPTHGSFFQSPSDHKRGSGCPKCARERLSERYRMEVDDFKERARRVHGDKYDYSSVVYTSLKDRVEIGCPVHGVFLQQADSHLRGSGCPFCYGNVRATKDSFIGKSRKVHGDKYDYSLVEYKNSTTKVLIICPNHGVFTQKPQDHLAGYGCPLCGGSQKLTTDEFIQRAIAVHGNTYDYSLVEYKNGQTKVKILCPNHGEFLQTPYLHALGSGCPKCKGRYKPSTEEFIDMARMVHGDKYDYSKVDYISIDRKVTIVCPIHGEFRQTPKDHIYNKRGCVKCSQPLRDLTTERFIKLAKDVHGNKYDYSQSVVSGSLEPVVIVCPNHGAFSQKPVVHIWHKSGCPSCLSSHLEGEIRQLLLSSGIEFEEQKEFEWLSYKRQMKLDFFLPRHNIAIECQGYQHFKSVSVFGGEDGYTVTKRRDELKRQLCEANGVKLFYYSNLGIEYPYDVFEDTELLLKEIRNTRSI